jgi:hypothetical protein
MFAIAILVVLGAMAAGGQRPAGAPLGTAGSNVLGTATGSPTAAPTQSPAPTTSPSPLPSPPPTAAPAATTVASDCEPTDQDQYVYNPDRLIVLAACIRASGVVEAMRTEADGDLHILLALDAPSEGLLRPANQGEELGDLVVEPVCVRSVTQADAIGTCAGDPDPFDASLPRVGQHVWMEGRYVLDSQHGDWAELHPLYRWGSFGAAAATPAPTAAAGPGGTTGYYTPPGWDGFSDVDCADFATHAQAQSFFLGTGGSRTYDPYRLDGDDDGLACERLP